jgi:hypothetical protein
MSEREHRDLARMRRELRDRLLSQVGEGAPEILDRFRRAAEQDPDRAAELRSEYERWRLRFDLLAVMG